MLKRIFLSSVAIVTFVISGPIKMWLSGDSKASLFSGRQLIVFALSYLAVITFVAFLETPFTLAWNWPWHRFWFFQDLIERDRRHRRVFPGLKSDERAALTEVLDDGRRRNLLSLLMARLRNLNPVPRILITGEGGSGKTTTMEQFRLSLVRESNKRLAFGRPIPVLLRMGSLGPGSLVDNARKVMEKGSRSSKVLSRGLDTLLKKGRVALLIDAIDESLGQSPNTFREVLDLIDSDDYERTPLIITGRRGDYERRLPGFVELYNIQELSNDAVRSLIDSYLKKQNNRDSATEIFSTLEKQGLLVQGGLGRNPFWLELILQGGTFENDKPVIFDKAIDSLLEREWGKSGSKTFWKRVLNTEEQLFETRAALSKLAYEVSLSNQGEQIDGQEALRIVAAYLSGRVGVNNILRPQDVLWLGRDAQLLYFQPLRADGDWPAIRFSHRLIREYLTANLLSKEPDSLTQVFERYADDTSWWEILLMLGSWSGKSSESRARPELVAAAAGAGTNGKRSFLAASMLPQMDYLWTDLTKEPVAQLVNSFRQGLLPAHLEAANAIARIAPHKLIGLLNTLFERGDAELRAAVEKLVEELLKSETLEAGTSRIVSMLLNDAALNEVAVPALINIGQPAVQHVIPILLDSSITARWKAAKVLGDIRDRTAVDPLLELLRDPNLTVRYQAISALGRIGDPAAIKHFGLMLNSDTSEDRVFLSPMIGKALGDIGEPAVEQLVSMLKEGPVLALFALDSLKQIGQPAVPIVIRELKNISGLHLPGIAEWLADLKAVEAIEPLIKLTDVNPIALQLTDDAFVKFGASAVEPLLAVVGEVNFLARRELLEILGKIGDSRAFDPLINILNTRKAKPHSAAEREEIFDRASAASALGYLGDPRALEYLEAAAKDTRLVICLSALASLVQLGQLEAISGIHEELFSPDANIRRVVIGQLTKVKQTGSLRHLERFVKVFSQEAENNRATSEELLKSVKEALQSIDTILSNVPGVSFPNKHQADDFTNAEEEDVPKERDFTRYASVLNHQQERIRLDVVKALSEIGAPATNLLQTAMSDESDAIRIEAARGLGKAKAIAAQRLLIESLSNDSSNGVRMAAAEALGDMGDPSVRPVLAKALDDRYLIVKIGAATALAKLGDENMLPVLFGILEYNDTSDLRWIVARAFAELEDPKAVPYLEKIMTRLKEDASSAQDESNLHHLSVVLQHLKSLREDHT